MPFGFFGIEGEKKKKEKKRPPAPPRPVPPRPAPAPMPAPAPAPAPMPEPIEIKPPAEQKQKGVPPWNSMTSSVIPVLIIGQTQELILDYLCAMKLNMDEAFISKQLSFYTKDSKTIADIVSTKKSLDACFRCDGDVQWPHYNPESYPESKTYVFSISIAGSQQQSLDLRFTCATFKDDVSSMAEQAQNIWILTEGSTAAREQSMYESEVGMILSSYPEKNIMLILSQFETLGRFRGTGEEAQLPPDLRRALFEGCRRIYGGMIYDGQECNAKMCQVQLYGGLELKKRNEDGDPIFGISSDSYCGSYVPVGCQMPVIHMLNDIKNSGRSFFDTPFGGQIWDYIKNVNSVYSAYNQWERVQFE